MDERKDFWGRWLLIVAMMTATGMSSIILVAPAPLLSEIMKATPALSPGQVVFMTMGAFNIVMVLGMLLGGVLLDKLGTMPAYMAAQFVMGLGAVAIPWGGHSFSGMICIRSLQALGAGTIMAAVIPIAARYFPAPFRSLMILLQGFAVTIGIKIGLSRIPHLFQITGSDLSALTWLGLTVFPALAFTLAAWALLRSRPSSSRQEHSTGIPTIKSELAKPATWGAVGAAAVITCIFQMLNQTISQVFPASSSQGMGSTVTLESIESTALILSFCGGLIGIWITEKVLKGNARSVVITGFILSAVSLALIKTSPSTGNHVVFAIAVTAGFIAPQFVSPQAYGYLAKYLPLQTIGTLGGICMGIAALANYGCTLLFAGLTRQPTGTSFVPDIIVGLVLVGMLLSRKLKPADNAR